MSIQENLESLREEIEKHAAVFGHKPEDITLCAATKTVDSDRIREAIQAGLTDCGENRVQELEAKMKEGAYEGARVHMIGRLQSNKIRKLTEGISLVQSVDRKRLIKEMERIGKRDDAHFDILLQVSIAGEEQKGGCPPDQVIPLIEYVEGLERVKIHGLMCVPPYSDDPEEVRPYFKKMREMFDKIKGTEYNNTKMEILSMGMTHDYKTALEEGATMVRLGTAIFGARDYDKEK